MIEATFAAVLVALVLWLLRDEIRDVGRAGTVTYFDLDGERVDLTLPDGCSEAEVWATIAWIDSLPEAGRV